jgi:hypothetical protein
VAEPRRAALCFLGEDILARLLSLPEGWQITGVRDDFMRNGIMIRITGPTAPEAVEGSVPWTFTPELEYEAPSEEELAANPHMAGKLRVVLPDWLLEGDDKPWTRDR